MLTEKEREQINKDKYNEYEKIYASYYISGTNKYFSICTKKYR